MHSWVHTTLPQRAVTVYNLWTICKIRLINHSKSLGFTQCLFRQTQRPMWRQKRTGGSLTMVLSMWSCRESISRSPTGCQVALASSARVSRRSSWSMELCSSWRRSRARSTWVCQPPTCPFRRSHLSRTSPVCLRMARANPRAFSSGVSSNQRDRGGREKQNRWRQKYIFNNFWRWTNFWRVRLISIKWIRY